MGCNKQLTAYVRDLHRQAEVALVGRLCTCGSMGWAEAKHKRGAGAWARGGRARAPLVLATAVDGQLSCSELRIERVFEI